jgi:uncharacterized membrane protein YfcA
VPFHVMAWRTIIWDTLYLALLALPVILLGAFFGIRLVKIIPEKYYRWFIIGMTLLAAIMMLLRS